MPEYTSWEYLVKNELARDHGRRMFYTDETGETVPASDDDEERYVSMTKPTIRVQGTMQKWLFACAVACAANCA